MSHGVSTESALRIFMASIEPCTKSNLQNQHLQTNNPIQEEAQLYDTGNAYQWPARTSLFVSLVKCCSMPSDRLNGSAKSSVARMNKTGISIVVFSSLSSNFRTKLPTYFIRPKKQGNPLPKLILEIPLACSVPAHCHHPHPISDLP